MAQSDIIGRAGEKERLSCLLRESAAGNGSTVIIRGEPGIGKTTLMDWLCRTSEDSGATILRGAASPEQGRPLLPFSSALERTGCGPLFDEQERISFSQLLAINPAGMLVAKASDREDAIDADIFAGMLTAVQSFVRDSFDSSGAANAGLGRLEYGTMKILIEHGRQMSLVAVLSDMEHPDMAGDLKRTLAAVEAEFGETLRVWTGEMSRVSGIRSAMQRLMEKRFAVKKDLTGMKLETERVKIASRVLATLDGLSSESPVLLALEDLQWADETSLFALRFLARNVQSSRILIACTSRNSDGPEWQRCLGQMREEGVVAEIEMDGMDLHGIATLINSECPPNDFPESFAKRLHGDCAGNPFFVSELLRQMRSDGAIAFASGRYVLAQKDYSIPESVHGIVLRRLDALEPDTMAMAEYLSCIGREFDIRVATSISTVSDPMHVLGRLSEAGIVRLSDGKAEFSHAIFHGTIYGGISGRWLQTHHRAIGEYYEKAHADDLQTVYYELARHFSLARSDIKAFDYCARAGEKAEGQFAIELAIEFYRKALAVLQKARIDQPLQERAMEITERLGDALMLTGSYDDAVKAYTDVAAYSDSPEVKARMHRKSSDGYLKRGDYDGCMDQVEKGLESAAGTVERLRLLHQSAYIMLRRGDLASAIAKSREIISELRERPELQVDLAQTEQTLGSCHYFKGEYDLALEHYGIAREIYEREGKLRSLGSLQNNIGNIHGSRAQHGLALEHYGKTLEIMEKLGDKQGISVALMNIAAVYQSMGELPKALEINRRSLRLGEMLGDRRIVSALMGNLGGIHEMLGEPDEGLEILRKCLKIKKEIDDKQGELWVAGNIGVILTHLGRYEEAREILFGTIAEAEKIDAKWEMMGDYFALGDLHADTGEFDRAEEYYRKTMEMAEKLETPDYLVESLRGLSEVMVATGRIPEAMAMSEEAVRRSSAPELRPQHGTALASMGKALAAGGDLAGAEAAFAESEEICTETSNTAWLARGHFEWGIALLGAGQQDRGTDMLRKAFGELDRIKFVPWRDRCAAAMAQNRIKP